MNGRKVVVLWKDTGKEVVDKNGKPILTSTYIPKGGISAKTYAIFQLINKPVFDN